MMSQMRALAQVFLCGLAAAAGMLGARTQASGRLALLTVIILAGSAFDGHASPAVAASATDLGKPTNDVSHISGSGPLGFFHYIKTSLHQGPRPEILFLGVQLIDQVEAERWPLIKALSQFGSFSGVSIWQNPLHTTNPSFPSFDLDHMVYRSRYVAFVNKDLLDIHNRPHAKLSSGERALFERYSSPLGPHANLYAAASRAVLQPGSKMLPLLAIGGYVQTFPTLPVSTGDFIAYGRTPTPCPPGVVTTCTGPTYSTLYASFSDVQRSLMSGRATAGLPQSLVSDVNAETNIITALICRADGKKPASACNRPVIRGLMKHTR